MLTQYDHLSQNYVKLKRVVFQCYLYWSSILCHTVVGVVAVEMARFSQNTNIGESTIQYILIYLSDKYSKILFW